LYPPPIPNNYGLAIGILHSIVKKSSRRQLEIVNEMFNEQLESGIIERVLDAVPGDRTHYLPYHFVIKEGKSTPLRIVYNGSAKRKKTDLSLNDCMYKGVNLLPNMLSVLLRFHLYRVAIIADIDKVFHQIQLHESERNFLRFLWTDPERQNQLITYRFKRIPFGIISSPFLLAAIIRYLFKRFKNVFRLNGNNEIEVLVDIYVDNLIKSVDSVEMAQRLFQNAIAVFQQAGMNIRA